MDPVVVVQHEPDVPPGSIKEVLDNSGIEHIVFHAWSEDDWPSARDVRALVVLGGTMNVDQTDAYPFIGRSISLVADALDHRVPTLGVCLGSQMMAKVLGQPVYRAVGVAPSGRRHYKKSGVSRRTILRARPQSTWRPERGGQGIVRSFPPLRPPLARRSAPSSFSG